MIDINWPLAICIDRSHARLVVKGHYQTPYERRITVYNPMLPKFQEINVNQTGQLLGVTGNALAGFWSQDYDKRRDFAKKAKG